MSRRSTSDAENRGLGQFSTVASPTTNTSSATIYNVPPSETPTVVGDGFVPSLGSSEDTDDDDDVLVSQPRQSTPSSPSHSTALDPPIETAPVEWHERVPSVSTVLEEIKNNTVLLGLFEDGSFFCDQSDQQIFFQIFPWQRVLTKMITAIKKYTPNNEKDIKKSAKHFDKEKHKIIDNFFCQLCTI